MKRLILSVLLFTLTAAASSLFAPFSPPVPFQTQPAWVMLDLGGGLLWQGPQLTQEKWDQRMALLPASAPLIPLDGFELEPLSLFQAEREPVTATPEPASMTMIGLGLLAGLLLMRGPVAAARKSRALRSR